MPTSTNDSNSTTTLIGSGTASEPVAISGKTIREVVGENNYARLEPYIRRVLAGEAILYEEELVTASKPRYVQGSYSPDFAPDGSVRGFFILVLDLSERRALELRLTESEARFSGAFQSAAIGMAIVSPEGRYLQVNAAMCRMLGYTPDEFYALSFQDITHPDDLDDDLTLTNATLTGHVDDLHARKALSPQKRLRCEHGPQRLAGSRRGRRTALFRLSGTGHHRSKIRRGAAFQGARTLRGDIAVHCGRRDHDRCGRACHVSQPRRRDLHRLVDRGSLRASIEDVYETICSRARRSASRSCGHCGRGGEVCGSGSRRCSGSGMAAKCRSEDSAAPIRDRSGAVVGAVLVFHDVTQQRALRARWRIWPITTPLTDLPNRILFRDRLEQARQAGKPDVAEVSRCFSAISTASSMSTIRLDMQSAIWVMVEVARATAGLHPGWQHGQPLGRRRVRRSSAASGYFPGARSAKSPSGSWRS